MSMALARSEIFVIIVWFMLAPVNHRPRQPSVALHVANVRVLVRPALKVGVEALAAHPAPGLASGSPQLGGVQATACLGVVGLG